MRFPRCFVPCLPKRTFDLSRPIAFASHLGFGRRWKPLRLFSPEIQTSIRNIIPSSYDTEQRGKLASGTCKHARFGSFGTQSQEPRVCSPFFDARYNHLAPRAISRSESVKCVEVYLRWSSLHLSLPREGSGIAVQVMIYGVRCT